MNEAGILLKFRVARYMKLVAGELEVVITAISPCSSPLATFCEEERRDSVTEILYLGGRC